MRNIASLLLVFFVFSFLVFSSHDAAAAPGDPIIKLDRSIYTWTDKIKITVIAPSLNLDPNKIDMIGNGTLNKITISTRGNSISPYTLTETGLNTGVFTGLVTLTGQPNIKNATGVDGYGKQPTGAGPSGIGPTDGFLPAEDQDGISVTFHTQNLSITKSAKIIWNLGQITWLPTGGTSSGNKILQIIDHDMNLNPDTQDTFSAHVFSNSDLAGIKLNMTETGPNTGTFQGILRFTNDTSAGSRVHLSGGNNTITGGYTDRTLPPPYLPADQIIVNATTYIINGNTTTSGQPVIKLDKGVYTWTDRVNITLISPALNLNSTKIETIGNNVLGKITISTGGSSISHYKLVETGRNTGIFTGYVILTGDPKIKGNAGVDGNGLNPTGAGPSGIGPTDGLLPSENIDGISVSFQNQHTVVATAPIRWNIGEIKWLKESYPVNGKGVLQIIDHDMNLNPKTIDKFATNVWSDSDLGGIKLFMTETGEATGVFQGTVNFTSILPSSGNRLLISEGDTVTGEYKDRTVPSPYLIADQLRLTSTTFIDSIMVPQRDSYIINNPADTNQGASSILKVQQLRQMRSLVFFDLSPFEKVHVSSATLKLFAQANGFNWNNGETMGVHKLTRSWTEGNGFNATKGTGQGVTWDCATDTNITNAIANCNPKWNGGIFEAIPSDIKPITNTTKGVWVEFNVTNDVNSFLDLNSTDNGWIIKKTNENSSGSVAFASKENLDITHRPQLIITVGP